MERNQAEEMSKAADRFAEAARELSATLNRFLEFQETSWERFQEYQRSTVDLEPEHPSYVYRGKAGEQYGRVVLGFLGAGGLSEDEAGVLADDLVHDVRKQFVMTINLPTPGPEEIRAWERRREERRRLEDNA